MEKKRHHYVAQAYLRPFCNAQGKLCVYSKDKGGEFWFSAPESIAFENHYFSQPTPDGGRDNSRLENAFAKIEATWTPLIEKTMRGEAVEGGISTLINFLLLHRVRVPTARDAHEKMRVALVRATARHLHETGRLPSGPGKLDFEYLERNSVVAIDPHTSIHAMPNLAKGMERVLNVIGYEILENETTEDFITSDNPVIYFDPAVSESAVQPYRIHPGRMQVELLFPMTPRHLFWGHVILRDQFLKKGVFYRGLDDVEFVRRVNRFVTRFSNRFVFSRATGHRELVAKYAGTSPVVEIAHIKTGTGRAIVAQSVFGRREPKPKWTGRAEP